ncbi:MAG: DUF2182 domain-containing protein [Hyphomicrobiales bacterium]
MIARLATHERALVVGGLALVAIAGWWWLLAQVYAPPPMPGMDMSGMDMGGMDMGGMAMQPTPWTPLHALEILAMWWIMMVAMMLPSALPAILLYAALSRRTSARSATAVAAPAWLFAAGYLVTWGAFSLAAAFVHWLLDRAGYLSPSMAATSAGIGGTLLLLAGLYEISPVKSACLTHCRSPLEWLVSHWKPGKLGAVEMGMRHGLWCVGCCFMLMALLFYGGVMNLAWIAGLALYVLAQKLAPGGSWIARFGGLALIAAGAFVLWRAFGMAMA